MDDTPRSRTRHRHAVSVVVAAPDGVAGEVLAVLRPPDDPELPDVWGLPAVRLRCDESVEQGVVRAGREKLGVELQTLRHVAAGSVERADYTLEMDLVQARIVDGEPEVPQPIEGVTQYVAWRWGSPPLLEPAARLGSLCCRLFLESSKGDR